MAAGAIATLARKLLGSSGEQSPGSSNMGGSEPRKQRFVVFHWHYDTFENSGVPGKRLAVHYVDFSDDVARIKWGFSPFVKSDWEALSEGTKDKTEFLYCLSKYYADGGTEEALCQQEASPQIT